MPVFTLDPTDQLFHTCAHGVKWEPVPSLRWIVDAAMILKDPIGHDRLGPAAPADRAPSGHPVASRCSDVPRDAARDARAGGGRWPRSVAPPSRGRNDTSIGSGIARRARRWAGYESTGCATGVYAGPARSRTRSASSGTCKSCSIATDLGALVRRALFRHRWRRQGSPVTPRRAEEVGARFL